MNPEHVDGIPGIPAQPLCRVADAARLLSISRSKVYSLMAAGQLGFVKIGRSRRVLVASLVGLIEASRSGR